MAFVVSISRSPSRRTRGTSPTRPVRLRSPAGALGVLALLLALLAALPAQAARRGADPADESLSSRERLEALVERTKRAQRELETMEARFVQVKESDLLVEPEESHGVFSYVAPDRVRWEYETPNPITVLVDGDEMLTWYRDLDRAERLAVGKYSSQVFKYLGASGSMETLVDYFRVKVRWPEGPAEPYRLELLPKYDRIAEKISSMTLWIDPERFFPTRFVYVTAGGDTTEYRFEELVINRPIPAERFEVELPPEVETRLVTVDRSAG